MIWNVQGIPDVGAASRNYLLTTQVKGHIFK
jgi:hypothetical protein